MRNVQQRPINAPAATVGALLDQVAGPDDVVWPVPAWPPLLLDAGLSAGSRGGHGPIRYAVTAHEPGRRLRFAFDRSCGVSGTHELLVEPEGLDRCRITHTIDARTHGAMRLLWPLAVRWLHEALTQDLLDNAERVATGRPPARPARWSRWVRLMRRARRTVSRSVQPPAAAQPPAPASRPNP